MQIITNISQISQLLLHTQEELKETNQLVEQLSAWYHRAQMESSFNIDLIQQQLDYATKMAERTRCRIQLLQDILDELTAVGNQVDHSIDQASRIAQQIENSAI